MEIFTEDVPNGSKRQVQLPRGLTNAALLVFLEKSLNFVDVFFGSAKKDWFPTQRRHTSRLVESVDDPLEFVCSGDFMLVGDLEVSDVFTSERLYWL